VRLANIFYCVHNVVHQSRSDGVAINLIGKCAKKIDGMTFGRFISSMQQNLNDLLLFRGNLPKVPRRCSGFGSALGVPLRAVIFSIAILNSGVYIAGVTPLPIPNREVKPRRADGTIRVTVWESRSMPDIFLHALCEYHRAFLFI
jgi:hypothetical protein